MNFRAPVLATALAALVLPPLRADNPGAIAGVHGHSDRLVSLSLGIAPETFPQYEGSDSRRTYWFPLVDLEIGRSGPWQVYAGASRNFVPLGQGVGVYPVHTSRFNRNVEIARTDTRPESRGDALAGLGDRRANCFASTRVSWRFLTGHLQTDLALMHGLLDDAGTLGFARVQLSNRSSPWFYAAAAKLTASDASNLRYDFGVSEEAATRRRMLLEEGSPALPLSQVGPYRPGGGFRSADATLSGGCELGERARVFGYAQY
jgi:outer membrane scaffolding protein for murein synthesis (MipA/OmpV family)